MRAERQQLDAFRIEHAVSQQTMLVGKPERVDANAGQIADLGIANGGIRADGAHSGVEFGLLRAISFSSHERTMA